MKIIHRVLYCCTLLTIPLFYSQCQQKNFERSPAVADQFYPADAKALRAMVSQFFEHVPPSPRHENVVAILSPHAGYVYSGQVAATAFNQLDAVQGYENVFIIGPSHRSGFEGAAVYSKGSFRTPFGTVNVNDVIAGELIRNHPVFQDRMDIHRDEHCIEVQIPFLQYKLKKPFRIIPIVIGTESPEICRSIAAALRQYLGKRNLFVVSTDFSHYPVYDDAKRIDKASADAVLSNSVQHLLAVLNHNAQIGVPHLATSMCGASAVITLLCMTEAEPGVEYALLQYKNSGDSEFGGKESVVGYCALAAFMKSSEKKKTFQLLPAEKKKLLAIVRATLQRFLSSRDVPTMPPSDVSASLQLPCGAFVTLQKHGELRGCIGRFDATEPLYSVVQQMGIAAATEDPRFPAVQLAELTDIEIEISVLTPMKKIESIDEIELGKHGIYIRKGGRAGTFLPQVAQETGWTKDEFLGHCAQDKAGIGWTGWKDADIYIYEALVFSEKELRKPE